MAYETWPNKNFLKNNKQNQKNKISSKTGSYQISQLENNFKKFNQNNNNRKVVETYIIQ